jgi:hypothetical protein
MSNVPDEESVRCFACDLDFPLTVLKAGYCPECLEEIACPICKDEPIFAHFGVCATCMHGFHRATPKEPIMAQFARPYSATDPDPYIPENVPLMRVFDADGTEWLRLDAPIRGSQARILSDWNPKIGKRISIQDAHLIRNKTEFERMVWPALNLFKWFDPTREGDRKLASYWLCRYLWDYMETKSNEVSEEIRELKKFDRSADHLVSRSPNVSWLHELLLKLGSRAFISRPTLDREWKKWEKEGRWPPKPATAADSARFKREYGELPE